MAEELFPTFEMPEIDEDTDEAEEKYKQSVYFDFETGDFKIDGSHNMVIADGREAYRQWCLKTIMTERYDHLAYNEDHGTEIDDAMREEDDDAAETVIERTITEALMENEHTENVQDFLFTRAADGMICSFNVKGKDLEELQLNLKLPAK
jgi:hypothetical protein